MNTPETDEASDLILEPSFEGWLEQDDGLRAMVLAHKNPARRPKVLFAMSLKDAMLLCSDPRSGGKTWMIVFSPITEWQVNGQIPSRCKEKDTGALDELIDELNLTKYKV